MAQWLPHMESLGADGLLLGPVFASVAHGYDTVSHREIDDRLGGVADLDALCAAASSRGIGVVMDGAFAYASRSFRRLDDPAEPGDPWFVRDPHGALVPWRVDSLVTPDYGSVGYQSYVADVMTSWLDRGVAGWRLDSAWSVPASFWRRVLTRVRTTHPAAWFLGQVFDDDLPAVVNRTTLSSTTEYALMHGVREWLAGGSTGRFLETLRLHRHNCCSRSSPHTFLGNHDFPRLADVVAPSLLPAAFCLLLTLPGIPGIYYGDEVATTSTWVRGGPDSLLRPAMSPSDVERLDGLAHDLLATVRRLGAFRRANTWLTTGALEDISTRTGAVSYVVAGDGRSFRVRVNPTMQTVRFPPDEERSQPVLGTETTENHHVEIPSRGWAIHRSPVR
ncbi:alpha-amylase family glycosyl hydrolase [Pseudonocardia sichuanensis]